MKIKLQQIADETDELENLARKSFGDTADSDISKWFSFNEMKNAIESHRGICIKAFSNNDKLLGFVYAQQESPINGKEGVEKWVIVIMVVDPDSAGQGVGSVLLKEIEKHATDRNARKIFVYTNKDDDKVISFYQKNNYIDAGFVKDYQYGNDNSAVFLLKHLS